MTFKAEDGTGLADATSYASVEYADAYFALRLNADWTGTPEQKQAALVSATDYIESRWSQRFLHRALTTTQALSFPRTVLGMPEALKKAICEYAVRALTSPLTVDVASGPQVVSTESAVGPVSDKTQYAPGTGSKYKSVPVADDLIRKLLSSGMLVR